MTPLQLAFEYMDTVFKTGEVDKLQHILAEDLKFRGPFYSFDTARDNGIRKYPGLIWQE